MSKYEILLKNLYKLNRVSKFKYNLDNIKKLSALFGDPYKQLEFIHITGTNGKGSTAYKLNNILISNNINTGLFTSPHLTTFRERLLYNNQKIEKVMIVDYLDFIFKKMEEKKIEGSFFEILTILSFLYFREKKAEIVILEVGIGGKFDCTNVIEKNLLSIITSVSYDHTNILGDSLEEILLNKAGIIKMDCPVLVGPFVPFKFVVENICKDLDSKFFAVDPQEFPDYFSLNNAIVQKAISILNEERDFQLVVKQEILEQNLNCRMEAVPEFLLRRFHFKNLEVFLDVGHNPEAIKLFISSVKNREKKEIDILKGENKAARFIFVYGTSKAKNSRSTLRDLKDSRPDSEIFLIQGNNPRSKEIRELKNEALESGVNCNIVAEGSIQKTLEFIFSQGLDNTRVLVFGSFFIMEESRDFFGFNDEKDFVFLNEFNSF